MIELLIKKLVLGAVILFLLTSFVPNINGNSSGINIDVNKNSEYNSETIDILFSDDFNDNSKDYSKWTEFYSDGEWNEINNRLEFKTNEGNPTNHEGIKSKDINAIVSTEAYLEISCKMITYISHYGGYVGQIWSQVIQGSDYIGVYYARNPNEVRIVDTKGTSKVLFYSDETSTPWDVQYTIFSDRYKVVVNGYDSGWIEKSIIAGNNNFNLIFYLYCNGDYPSFWYKAGFDDILVVSKHAPTTPTINGPTKFFPNIYKEFRFTSTDQDGDQIYYYIEWGDGSIIDWQGPFPSGTQYKASHKWVDKATFTIKCKTKDIYGVESGIGTLGISTSKSSTFNTLFLRLLENNPNFLPFFQKLQNII